MGVAALNVKKIFGKPVFVVISYPLNPEEPYHLSGYYGRGFDYSKAELERFLSQAKKLAGFHSATIENYDVYVI